MKKSITFMTMILLFTVGVEAEAALPPGFDKATWGMTQPEFMSAYQVHLAPPSI
ncbi:MAG: hypothetical protein MPW14_23090 [Candidatus Manganitrophus sp.]|nr:MAG: hypothetical protein MPW14_23090 [Candidatus Manganitrophus sp.]